MSANHTRHFVTVGTRRYSVVCAEGRAIEVGESYRPKKAVGWSKERYRVLWTPAEPPASADIRDAITLGQWQANEALLPPLPTGDCK